MEKFFFQVYKVTIITSYCFRRTYLIFSNNCFIKKYYEPNCFKQMHMNFISSLLYISWWKTWLVSFPQNQLALSLAQWLLQEKFSVWLSWTWMYWNRASNSSKACPYYMNEIKKILYAKSCRIACSCSPCACLCHTFISC